MWVEKSREKYMEKGKELDNGRNKISGWFRDESFPQINGLPLFFSKILGNEMCQTWSKQSENQGI